jgi:hypothetical protein
MKTIPMRRARRMNEHGRSGANALAVSDAVDVSALHDETAVRVFVRMLADFAVGQVQNFAEAEAVRLDFAP